MTIRIRGLATLASVAMLATVPAAHAQSPAEFYRGKKVDVLIGVGVGGEYDQHARLTARWIGKHIPGNPNVVPQNMTGAGGLKMANFLYAVAPKDGTAIGMIANNFPMVQAVEGNGVQFDANKFLWIGSISPTVETLTVWHTANINSVADAKTREVVVGASGRGAITYVFPAVMNAILGTKFKIVTGYEGGNAINLAMEKGEVEGRNNTWSSWKTTHPDWLKDGTIKVIAWAGPKPKDMPDSIPSLESLAANDDDRQIIELAVSGTYLGRPLATTPGVSADRVKALRDAFDATMKDPEFLKDAAQMKIEVEPVRGEDMQKIVAKVLATPKNLAMKAKEIVE
ncbi:MAG: Bug family tripartite tricarboxylate transporter substrate binding protein [Gemmatimonas sp.]